jgi:nicotinamide-nucleotide amidase
VNGGSVAERVIAELAAAGFTVAVAESLTGGLLTAELTSVPGASAVVTGGVVAYNTELKARILGVDAALLARHGAVHAEVAAQMARTVRTVLAVDGRPADVGLATTGVAGPAPQDSKPVGTVFVGLAFHDDVIVTELHLRGDRTAIRAAVVSESLAHLLTILDSARPSVLLSGPSPSGSSQEPRE